METKHTDKDLLVSGIKKMALALICMFIGPTLTYISAEIEDSTKKIAALVLGILICLIAIYLAFMGIKTIMKSKLNR